MYFASVKHKEHIVFNLVTLSYIRVQITIFIVEKDHEAKSTKTH